MIPSEQQSSIEQYTGQKLVVKAGAGTGKTSTLERYARANPTVRMLYLAFNKAIQEEAASRFPPNVLCRTTHSIAYRRIGINYKHKLTGNWRLTDVRKYLGTHDWKLAGDAIDTLNAFLASADVEISEHHLGKMMKVTSRQKAHVKAVLKSAKRMWSDAIDLEADFPCTHDTYLKLYALKEPELHKWVGCILFDEAQDANPVTSSLVLSQQCSKIFVGDDHQQIYRWRGAENALDSFIEKEGADVLYLTQSYRFGTAIAQVANDILAFKSLKTGSEPFALKGHTTNSTLVKATVLREKHHCVLHRTVSGTISTALDNLDKKIYWVGGINAYNLQEILDVYYLSSGQKDKVKRKKLLTEYKGSEQYKDVAKSSGDHEMQRTVRVVGKHSAKLPNYIEHLRRNAVLHESEADLTITTAHRAKGLEWDAVIIDNDFPDLFKEDKPFSSKELADELNLLYVSITRAICQLCPNNSVIEVRQHLEKQKKLAVLPKNKKGKGA